MRLRFVAAMARRELRVAVRRFALYGSCMAIGIAAVVGLQALRDGVERAVDERSRELLGADLRLEAREPLDGRIPEALASLERDGELPPTRVARLGSMALVESSGLSRLVELVAIDGRYPLYGEVWTEPAGRWSPDRIAPGEVFVDSALLMQMDAVVGGDLRLGSERFRIAASVQRAPGSFGLRSEVAPRVFLSLEDLGRTGLVQEGSLVSHLLYWKLPVGVAERWVESHRRVLETERVRFQTVGTHQEELAETFDSLTRYLGLIGLAALVLGGIGVAAGVRVYVREKLETVALLRSLGARPVEVVAIYGLLAACLGLAAGGLGLGLAWPLLGVLPTLVGEVLSVDLELRIGVSTLATALGLGLGATLVCAFGPLLDLAAIAPLRALRREFGGNGGRTVRGRLLTAALVVAAGLGISIVQAGDIRVGLGFAVGLVATLVVLGAVARGLMMMLRRSPPRSLAYWLRQGIANLSRPRNHTLPTVLAIGFALFVVATVHAVATNVLAQLAVDSRPDRPNLVLFDVQRDQVEEVLALLDRHRATITDRAPLISARIAAVGARSRSDWLAEDELPRDRRWALEREYRLTYADALRDSERLVAGEWWAQGEAETAPYPISVERDLAESLGVELGDAMTWLIQGVEIETRVASFRHVDWERMATNFFVVFPPAALETAPQSTVLLAHLADEEARAALQRELVSVAANVAVLDATWILRALDTTFEQVGLAVRVLSLFTLATGLAILVAASLAARRERAREAVLLRVLGASRATLRGIATAEAVALGAVATIAGGGLAALASWLLVVLVFELPFAPPVLDLLGLVAITFLVTTLFGALGAVVGGARPPRAALREVGF